MTLYRDKASSWETALRNYALTLFFLLAAIEFAISAIRLAIRGSDASEWLAELVNQVLFLGFFLALLNNSSAWARAIVDSFRTAANQAAISSGGSSNLAPSDIFDTGLSIASKVADQTSLVLARLLAGPHCLRACHPHLLCAHRGVSRRQPCRIPTW